MKEVLLFILIMLFLFFGCAEILNNEPFGEIVVALTFDDTHFSIYKNAYPITQEFGYSVTNYIHTGVVNTENHLTLEELHILEDEGGWETGGHTVNHVNLTHITLEMAEAEIKGCWQFLKENNLEHNAFALPSGHSNANVTEIIKKYFNSIRQSEDYKMKCPIDRYSLGYYYASNTDGSGKIIGRILRGITNHEYLVIIGFHRVVEHKETHPRAITPQEFREILQFIQDRNLRVLTVSQAIKEL